MPTGIISIPTTALGQRLRDLRLKRGWTQWQVAEMLDTRANRISDWETGRYEPSLPVLKKFAAIFDLTVSELLKKIM